MISKELLSEVLGKEVINFNNTGLTLLYNYYILEGMDNHKRPKGDKINLYELAHKCKEWVLRIGYHVTTLLYDDNANRVYTHGLATVHYSDDNSNYLEVFSCEAPTEPEATFKACQWILDNKEIK